MKAPREDLPPRPLPTPRLVELWWMECPGEGADLARWEAALSPTEQAHAATLQLAPVRRRFIYFRGELRRLLARYLDRAPPELEFTLGEHGKPALAHPAAPAFNLSHSGDHALLGVTGAPALGIDLESTQRRAECLELAERFFAPAEAATLRVLPAAAQTVAFFTGWVRKEAWIKALGTGLATPLDAFTVSLDAHREDAWMLDPGPTGEIGAWTFLTPPRLPCPHSLAAVAVRGRGVSLRWAD